MKKNSNAFTLIKSLTMSEKRYFKIFSERHTIGTQNKYVLLFSELDKSIEENDIEIKIRLTAVGINSDFLSADKNYLYHLILRSLNEFHNSRTFNLELKESLLSIEILFHKGLYQECLKLISRAEDIANECENFQLMIDVLNWKKKCSGYSLGLAKANEVNKYIDKYIILLNNLKRITDLYYESNLLQSNYEKQTKTEVLKKFQTILKQNELKDEDQALSFSAKIFFHLIYSNYYFTVDSKENELFHLQKLVDILNASKIYALENPLDYVSIVNRLLSIKKYFPKSNFFEDINVLKNFPSKISIKKDVVSQRVFIHANTHELEYYLINNQFQNALDKIKTIEKDISKQNVVIEPYHSIYFYYLQASILVFVGKFHHALKFVNKILNEFNYDDRPQVYMRIEVLNIILHFELKNFTLVSSLSKQLLKKNVSKNILNIKEGNILKALIKIVLAKNFSLRDELNLFDSLIDKEVQKNTTTLNINLLNENYEKWLLAKVKRKLVSEIFE
jgi:hypothetical protein